MIEWRNASLYLEKEWLLWEMSLETMYTVGNAYNYYIMPFFLSTYTTHTLTQVHGIFTTVTLYLHLYLIIYPPSDPCILPLYWHHQHYHYYHHKHPPQGSVNMLKEYLLNIWQTHPWNSYVRHLPSQGSVWWPSFWSTLPCSAKKVAYSPFSIYSLQSDYK